MKTKLVFLLAASVLMLDVSAFAAAKKGKSKGGGQAEPAVPVETIVELINTNFGRWDKNKNGVLDPAEVVGLIESPVIRGLEAAFLSRIFRTRFKDVDDDGTPDTPQSKDCLLALANQPAFHKNLSDDFKKISTGNRALMMPGDPSLSAFHQGAIGDCYFMAAVAAAVNRDPAAVRGLFKPAGNGEVAINWANGRTVTIPPITDGEYLLAGAHSNKGHGIWLKTLEKAFAQARVDKKIESGLDVKEDATFGSLIGKGGSPVGPMTMLSGRPVKTEMLSHTKDLAKREERAERLISNAAADHRLVCCGGVVHDFHTPGLPSGHIYAILGYDVSRRLVHVYNPWGNDFTPKGVAGIKFGYGTRDGSFFVPVAEFSRLFSFICYEAKE